MTASASAAGLADDICRSVQGIGALVDAALANVDSLDLEGIEVLKHRVENAYAGSGRRADAWRMAALRTLAQRQRTLIAGTAQESTINFDENTRLFPASGVGAKAGQRERSFFERIAGGRRHR